MILSNRVIYSDNGSLTDYSNVLNRWHEQSVTLTLKPVDFIYLGASLPFNHRYFHLGDTVNSVSAQFSLEYWNGSQWIDTVEIVDETNTLSQSAHLQFVTDKDESTWAYDDTNRSGRTITGLGDVTIYDLYWARLATDTLLEAVEFKYIGWKFCDDNYLGTRYPDLTRAQVYEMFQSGKTDWDEQHFVAADKIGTDLKKRGIAYNRNQVLDFEVFREPAAHAAAAVIYSAFGDDYKDRVQGAIKDYEEAFDLAYANMDWDRNARLGKTERLVKVGKLWR